jgi:hypothetical protein
VELELVFQQFLSEFNAAPRSVLAIDSANCSENPIQIRSSSERIKYSGMSSAVHGHCGLMDIGLPYEDSETLVQALLLFALTFVVYLEWIWESDTDP